MISIQTMLKLLHVYLEDIQNGHNDFRVVT